MADTFYIESKLIKIYPTAYRGKNSDDENAPAIFNPESRLFTEENTTRPFDKLADFVIPYEQNKPDKKAEGSFVLTKVKTSSPFEFVLNGYYFSLDYSFNSLMTKATTELGNNFTELYARLTIVSRSAADPDNVKFKARTLVPVGSANINTLDDSDNLIFLGLDFIPDPFTRQIQLSNDDKYLLIARKEDNEFIIPTESTLKFERSAIHGGNNKSLDKHFETLDIETTDIKAVNVKNKGNANLNLSSTLDTKIEADGDIEIRAKNEKLKLESYKDIEIEAKNIGGVQGKIKLKDQFNEILLNASNGIELKTQEADKTYVLPSDYDGTPDDWGEDHTLASREWSREWVLNGGNKIFTSAENPIQFQLREYIEPEEEGEDPTYNNLINVSKSAGADVSLTIGQKASTQVGEEAEKVAVNITHYGDIEIGTGNNGSSPAIKLEPAEGKITSSKLDTQMIDSFYTGIAQTLMLASRESSSGSSGSRGFRINSSAFYSGAGRKNTLTSYDDGLVITNGGIAMGQGKSNPDDSGDTANVKLTSDGRIRGRHLDMKDSQRVLGFNVKTSPLTPKSTLGIVVSGTYDLEPLAGSGSQSVAAGTYDLSSPSEVYIDDTTIQVNYTDVELNGSSTNWQYVTYRCVLDQTTATYKTSLIFVAYRIGECWAISYNTNGNVSYGYYADSYTSLNNIFGTNKVAIENKPKGVWEIKNSCIQYKSGISALNPLVTIDASSTHVSSSSYYGDPYICVSNGNSADPQATWIRPDGTTQASSTIVTSDRDVKHNILNISKDYEKIFDNLKPVTFKLISGKSGRTHIGFVAQDVKAAIQKAGLTTQDMAAYCEYTDPSQNGAACGLRYEEFIALNTHEIQRLKKEIKALKAEIAALKK